MKKFLPSVSLFYRRHRPAVIRTAILLLFSLLLPLLTETIVRNNFLDALYWPFDYPEAYIFTAALIMLVQFFLFTLFRRVDIPVLSVGLAALFLGTACYFKLTFRSEPLFPWDISLAGTALDISKEMEIVPTASMYICFALVLILFAFLLISRLRLLKSGFLRKYLRGKKNFLRAALQVAVSLAVTVLFFFFIFINSTVTEFFGIKESAFRQAQAYSRNGVIQSFCLNTKYVYPEKPDGYSESSVTRAVSEINGQADSDTVKPNIIYLMSESYADISLCKNVTYNDDIFFCTDVLKSSYISGSLLTTQFGGGTCNSEFEVLTGFSMNNLPSGCTPYQQYFNREQPSYVEYLKQQGYSTVAIHSYGRNFWNRSVAYPNMGFDKFLAEESFENPERRRGLIKDDELVSMIIEQYEENIPTGKPFFNFSVSMQNHGSFTDGQYLESYRASLSCDQLSPEQEGILTTYATGIRDANIALDKLIGYFSGVSEPTIICMFGDHLGSLGGSDEIYIKSGYMNDPESSAEDKRLKYSTPFFVWDNFTSMSFTAENMSLYNLIPSICSWYDLDRPRFFDYLLEQSEHYRGSGLGIYLDSTGTAVYSLNDSDLKYFEKHKLFQYDLMFGKRYSEKEIYS